MFDLTALRQAAELIGRHVPPTPQYNWPLLSQRLGWKSGSSTKTTRRPVHSRFAAACSTCMSCSGASHDCPA